MTNEELDGAIVEWATNNCSIEIGEEMIEGHKTTAEDLESGIHGMIKIIYDVFEKAPGLREQLLTGDKEELDKQLKDMFDNLWLFPLPSLGDDAKPNS